MGMARKGRGRGGGSQAKLGPPATQEGTDPGVGVNVRVPGLFRRGFQRTLAKG